MSSLFPAIQTTCQAVNCRPKGILPPSVQRSVLQSRNGNTKYLCKRSTPNCSANCCTCPLHKKVAVNRNTIGRSKGRGCCTFKYVVV